MSYFKMGPLKPSHYPLIIKEVHGSLVLYCPDLEIYEAERIEDLTAEALQIRITRLWGKIQLRIQETERLGQDLKEPSLLTDHFNAPLGKADLSVRQVAGFIGCSEQTVRRLVEQKKLNAVLTPGGHRRFLREEVEKYLDEIRNSS